MLPLRIGQWLQQMKWTLIDDAQARVAQLSSFAAADCGM
jgi:hypothetical protein